MACEGCKKRKEAIKKSIKTIMTMVIGGKK